MVTQCATLPVKDRWLDKHKDNTRTQLEALKVGWLIAQPKNRS